MGNPSLKEYIEVNWDELEQAIQLAWFRHTPNTPVVVVVVVVVLCGFTNDIVIVFELSLYGNVTMCSLCCHATYNSCLEIRTVFKKGYVTPLILYHYGTIDDYS